MLNNILQRDDVDTSFMWACTMITMLHACSQQSIFLIVLWRWYRTALLCYSAHNILALQMNNKPSYAQNMKRYIAKAPISIDISCTQQKYKGIWKYIHTWTASKSHTKHQRTLESANNKMIRDISLNYGREAYVRAESKLYGTDEKTWMLLIMRTLKGGRAVLAY